MRRLTRIATLIAVAGVMVAGEAWAQEPEAAPETRPRRMRVHEPGTGLEGGPAMRQRMRLGAGELPGMRAFAPDVLIERKDFLGLSEEQVSRLGQLSEELQGVRAQVEEQVKASHEALLEAWQADPPDADVVRRYAQQAMEAQQAARLAMVGSSAEAKALLTPEQQAKMTGWAEGMRHGMRMGRGMPRGGQPGSMGYRRRTPPRQP